MQAIHPSKEDLYYTDQELLSTETKKDMYATLDHTLFGEDSSFLRFYVFGDGNCFFHTIAFLLNYNRYRNVKKNKFQQHLGVALRKRIVCRKQWDRFLRLTGFEDVAPSYDKVVSRSYFADDFVYNFVSRRIKMAIVVLSSMTEIFSTHVLETLDDTYPIVLIAWLQNVHFEPIVQARAEPSEEESERWESHDNPLCQSANSTQIRALFVKSDPIIQRIIQMMRKNTRQEY